MRYKTVATLAILVGCLLTVGMAGIAAAEENRTEDFSGTFDPYSSENMTVENSELVLGSADAQEVTQSELANINDPSGDYRVNGDVYVGSDFDATVNNLYVEGSLDVDDGTLNANTIYVRDYMAMAGGTISTTDLYVRGDGNAENSPYAFSTQSSQFFVSSVNQLEGNMRVEGDVVSTSNNPKQSPNMYYTGSLVDEGLFGSTTQMDAGTIQSDYDSQTTADQGTYTERYAISDELSSPNSSLDTLGTVASSDVYYENGYIYVDYTLTDNTQSVNEYTVSWDEVGTVEIANLETEDVTGGETATISADIQNPGDTEITQDLHLTVDGEEVDSTTVTLAGGESKTVPLEWDTALADSGSTHEIEVASEDDSATGLVFVEQAPPEFDISVFDPATDIVEGDTVTAEVDIKNLGQTEGTQDITLEVGGSQVDTTDVTLAGGASTSVTLEWQTESGDGGQTYTMTASSDNSSMSSETYVVEQAHFGVSGVSGETVVEGEMMTVDATITNTGENKATQTVVLEADGVQVDSTDVSLAEGESTDVTFDWEPTAGGTSYDLEVRSDDASGTDLAYVEKPGTIEIEAVDIEDGVEGTISPVSVDLVNPGDTGVTQNVTFEIDGTEANSTTVPLAGGESTTVDFEWRPEEPGEYTATFTTADDERTETVTVLSESAFNVVIKNPPEEIVAGENESLRVDVINTGDQEDTQNLSYSFAGTAVETRQVTLEGDSYEIVHFDLETDVPGEFQYTVSSEDDSDEANVTALAAGDLRIADVDAPDTVDKGENATADVTIENVGDVQTTETAQFYVDGNLVEGREVAEGTVSFDLPTDEPGEYNYTVELADDAAEFSVTVTESSGVIPTGDTRSWPVYLLLGLAGATGLVGVITYRRR